MPFDPPSELITAAVLETLDTVVSPNVRDSILQAALREHAAAEVLGQGQSFHHFVRGPLRAALIKGLGQAMADTIVGELEAASSSHPTARSGSAPARSRSGQLRAIASGVPRAQRGQPARASRGPAQAPPRSLSPRPRLLTPRGAPEGATVPYATGCASDEGFSAQPGAYAVAPVERARPQAFDPDRTSPYEPVRQEHAVGGRTFPYGDRVSEGGAGGGPDPSRELPDLTVPFPAGVGSRELAHTVPFRRGAEPELPSPSTAPPSPDARTPVFPVPPQPILDPLLFLPHADAELGAALDSDSQDDDPLRRLPPTVGSSALALRPLVVILSRDAALARSLQKVAGSFVSLEVAADLFDLLHAVEGAGHRHLLIVLDCKQPSVRPVALAALAEELPSSARIVLWEAGREVERVVLSVAPAASSWARYSEASLMDLGYECVELGAAAGPE